eukprot:5687092-Amphidinium_carterae.6
MVLNARRGHSELPERFHACKETQGRSRLAELAGQDLATFAPRRDRVVLRRFTGRQLGYLKLYLHERGLRTITSAIYAMIE